MKQSEILKQQKNKVLQKIRKRAADVQEDVPATQSTSVRVVSNVSLDPLEGWPAIFDHLQLPASPTDVQRFVIPYILKKESVSVISETGSGKTLSYVLPFVHILENEETSLLVVVPTRELVSQVTRLFRQFSSDSMQVVGIVGGREIDAQRVELSRPFDVVVSTPGRLRELIELRCVGRFEYAVVDEVDRLLSCNFREDIDFILEHVEPRICSYFSATFFERSTGTRILVGNVSVNRNIEEHFAYVESGDKTDTLRGILESPNTWAMGLPGRREGESSRTRGIRKIIVFCNTIKSCESLHKTFKESILLHSKKSMMQREAAIEEMGGGDGVLITTDLAGRGIDIPDVDLVVNYGFPTSVETYIHRCGRTGRQRSGIAFSMLCGEDRSMFGRLRRLIQERGGSVPGFLNVQDEFITE